MNERVGEQIRGRLLEPTGVAPHGRRDVDAALDHAARMRVAQLRDDARERAAEIADGRQRQVEAAAEPAAGEVDQRRRGARCCRCASPR